MMDDHSRILLLSAAMGGGHTQVARELGRRFQQRGHTAVVADLLELMPPPTGRWLGSIYPWLVNRAPRLYQRVYDTFFVAEQRAGERAGIPVQLALEGARRLVNEVRPDLTVSTYPLSALVLGELRRRGDLAAPAATVVTTFSLNNLWLHPSADLELCISADAAAETSRRTGREALVCGPVVRPGFLEPHPDPGAVRASLGLPASGRIALVTTGSIGLAGAAVTAATTIAGHPDWLPVVLCGGNEQVRRQVADIPGAVALDWVDEMSSLMGAVDVLVDNNCGMSAKEALAAGLPVVTFRPIPGHGRDDAAALARLGLTDVVHSETHLLRAVDRLVEDRALRRDRVERGRELFVADAASLLEGRLDRPFDRAGTGRRTPG